MKRVTIRKEFQWTIVYFGSLMTFVVFPLATSKYAEQIRSQRHAMEMAETISLVSAIVYGWAMLSLVKSKQLSDLSLWVISGFAFFFFLFGQLVAILPPYQWTVGMFSLACGILCAGSVSELFQKQKVPACTKEKSLESPDSH